MRPDACDVWCRCPVISQVRWGRLCIRQLLGLKFKCNHRLLSNHTVHYYNYWCLHLTARPNESTPRLVGGQQEGSAVSVRLRDGTSGVYARGSPAGELE